jgi:glucoamylase
MAVTGAGSAARTESRSGSAARLRAVNGDYPMNDDVIEQAVESEAGDTGAAILLPNVSGGAAIGAPGIAPTWSSSDKDFITTALGGSRLWATVGHGIINEVYWPSTGQPQIRDFGFYLVGQDHWIDLKRARRYRLTTPGPCLPALTVLHYGDDYQLALEVLPDPLRDVLLVRFNLTGPYKLVVIVAPHLGSTGRNNFAWTGTGAGYARCGDFCACLAADVPLLKISCGYVGASDGWQDLNRHGALTYRFDSAENGTVALTAEAAGHCGVLALGFSYSAYGAFTRARTSLAVPFEATRADFLQTWHDWGARLQLPRPDDALGDAGLLSAVVLKTHEDRAYPGAVVASLSVPWGNSTDSVGGYHLVWPRDATLTAFALLAANQLLDARHILAHLAATQLPDGHWPQNYFPSGEPFWVGIQLDAVAFPVLLAAKMRELGEAEQPGTTAMVRAAVGFIARTGPSSPQDRWEENTGVNPFTIATAISALVAAGPWLTKEEHRYALSLADDWNERLEAWCYVRNTALASDAGVAGYYVRIGNPADGAGDISDWVQLRNREGQWISASTLVSLDFSYLVRLGLRSAHDPRVQDTIKVVDRVLKVDTPSGSLYHRYNGDGYGEHADGRPFDGGGIGRAWPLLVGERGHLAMQSGEDPISYLQTMWRCSSAGGLLPEQVWDAAAIPHLELYPGRPCGSAMPLLWAHAEYLKLLVARERQRPIELLDAVEQRYLRGHSVTRGISGDRIQPPQHRGPTAPVWHWRDEVPVLQLEAGRALLIEDRSEFTLHFGFDSWQRVQARAALRQPFGIWGVILSAAELAGCSVLNFTRRFGERWEGLDHRVSLGHVGLEHALAPVPSPSATSTTHG